MVPFPPDAINCETLICFAEKLEIPIDTCLIECIQKKYKEECFVYRDNIIMPDIRESDIRSGQDMVKRAKKMRWNISNFDIKI